MVNLRVKLRFGRKIVILTFCFFKGGSCTLFVDADAPPPRFLSPRCLSLSFPPFPLPLPPEPQPFLLFNLEFTLVLSPFPLFEIFVLSLLPLLLAPFVCLELDVLVTPLALFPPDAWDLELIVEELEFAVDEFNRIFPPGNAEFPCFCLLTAALAAAIISAALRGTLAFAASLLLFPLETGETVPPSGLGFELPPPINMSNRYKNQK